MTGRRLFPDEFRLILKTGHFPPVIVSNHLTDYDYCGLLDTHFAVVLSPYWKNMEKWMNSFGLRLTLIYARESAS